MPLDTENFTVRLSALLVLLVLLVFMSSVVHAADTLYDQRFSKWTEQAQTGAAAAQYDLGNAYLRGNGVDRDIKKALFWLRKSAAQHYAKAEYRLGYLYYVGEGVRQNFAKAFVLLNKSARRNYSPAQYYLGRLYAKGKGVEQDYHKAQYWYRQAAADHYPSAKAEAAKMAAAISAEKKAATTAKQQAQQDSGLPSTANQAPGKVSTATAAKPAHAPRIAAVANPPAPATAKSGAKPTAPQRRIFDTEKLLFEGKWLNERSAAAKHLPSTLTNCTENKGNVDCKTGKLKRSNLFAQVTYVVESEFKRFTPQGRFMGSYRTNVLFVLPADPDNPDPSEEDIPSTGWQPKTILKCQFTDTKHIDCVNDNFQREKFTRK